MSKLPEPDTHCFDEDTQTDVWSYSKELVEQMLSQADKDASDLMLIVHMKQAAKYDPVLKQALEALTRWKNANTFSGRINAQKPGVDAIDAIKGVLG